MTGSITSGQSAAITRLFEFFSWIWTPEGWKCICILTPSGMRHHWFASIDEAAEFAINSDAQGLTVYHGCASYQEQIRKQENVHKIRSYWLDVDCGPGKPYPDTAAAWAGLCDFAERYRLPTPLSVGSGGGLHLYWPLTDAVTPEEWIVGARALKRACDAAGFHADPARTADSASILRPPGTHNWKYRGRPVVTCGDAVGPYEPAEFLRLLERGLSVPGETLRIPAGTAARSVLGPRDALTAAALAVHGERPTSGERVANECAQVRAMRDTKGNVPEPLWFASICVLRHCDVDGHQLAHDWSAGYPSYTWNETEKKFEHASKTGPTTCARFYELNPEGCKGCPHRGKITSPVQMGREAVSIKPALPHEAEIPPPPLPYMWRNGMLTWLNPDEEATDRLVILFPYFIAIIGFRAGESLGGRTISIKYQHPHEGWKHETIELATMDTKALMGKLLTVGIVVPLKGHKLFHDFVIKSVHRIQEERRTEMQYEQFGWKEDKSFLVGYHLYSPGQKAPVDVGVSNEAQQRADLMRPIGNYRDWTIAANKMFARGFEGQAFAMLCSFAAPLMRFMRASGGCIVHQVGEGGTGKTMGLRAAWTVWGHEHAVNVNRIDTMNARYREIAVLSNLPVIFDELRERDDDVTKEFVLSFTDGRDKNRLDRSGNLVKLRHGWSTIIISAANDSLAQSLMKDNEHAQAARVLEFASTLPDSFDQTMGSKLDTLFDSNRGHAGRRFIQNLVQPNVFDWCREATKAYEAEYSLKIGVGGEHRFYSSLLAAVKVAGELLNTWGMLEFTVDRFIAFGIDAAQVNRQGIIDQKPNYPVLLQKFINTHWRQTLVVFQSGVGEDPIEPQLKPTSDHLYVRVERREKMMYVDKFYLRDWCTENHIIFNEMEANLAASGVLVDRNFQKNLGLGTAWSAAGYLRTWRINLAHRFMGYLELIERAEKPHHTPTHELDFSELDRDAREGA